MSKPLNNNDVISDLVEVEVNGVVYRVDSLESAIGQFIKDTNKQGIPRIESVKIFGETVDADLLVLKYFGLSGEAPLSGGIPERQT